MGRGLSLFQKQIMSVLGGFVSYEDSIRQDEVDMRHWARPRDILAALGMGSTAQNRATLTRALDRLVSRGLVARGYGYIRSPGNGARYSRKLGKGGAA